MDRLSLGELYAAYRLYLEAAEFGAKSPPSEKLIDFLAEKALNDWLKNFKAEKWTYKELRRETTTYGDENNADEIVEKFVVRELDTSLL